MSHGTEIAENFRLTLRGVGASATIISTSLAHKRYGMVATAIMPVSMEPPSLVISVNRSASLHDPLTKREAFAVNILSRWDEPIATGFMQTGGEARFAFGPWANRQSKQPCIDGLPYLANAQAAVLCKVTQAVPSGTHTLFIGEVLEVLKSGECSSLMYCNGSYGTFLPTPKREPVQPGNMRTIRQHAKVMSQAR